MRAGPSLASGKDILEFIKRQFGSWNAITRRTKEASQWFVDTLMYRVANLDPGEER